MLYAKYGIDLPTNAYLQVWNFFLAWPLKQPDRQATKVTYEETT